MSQLPPKSTEVKEIDWNRSQSTGVPRKCEKIKVRDSCTFLFRQIAVLRDSGLDVSAMTVPQLQFKIQEQRLEIRRLQNVSDVLRRHLEFATGAEVRLKF